MKAALSLIDDSERCVYCECVLTVRDETLGDRPSDRHRDHLIPRSRGGSDQIENCVVACRECNLSKRDKTPSEWRAGLKAWVYEKEKTLAAKYRMPSRGRREQDKQPPSMPRIPGYSVLKNKMAVCLEFDHRQCRAPADWEVQCIITGTWGAHCARCANYYSARLRRELDEIRGIAHILVQLRDGTLDPQQETTMRTIARANGVSVVEYIDLAVQMVTGEASVRAALKEAFPALRLELWEPTLATFARGEA